MESNTPFIDIHAHVNFAVYDEDRLAVIKRALDNNVYSIHVGTQYDTSKNAIELAESFDKGVYAIVGIHPIHSDKCFHDEAELGKGNKEFTSRGEKLDIEKYRELLSSKKVVGIGECGLDYYHLDEGSIKKQKDNFLAQVSLAKETQKALMLHVRKSSDSTVRSAYLDVADILKAEDYTGNFHFFAGTIDEARILLDLGATFSFTGVITFAKEYEELVKFIPNDRIMSETDCPYVTPVPHRGKRNEPVYVIEIVKKMAEIKGIPLEEMKSHIFQNAKKVFGIEK